VNIDEDECSPESGVERAEGCVERGAPLFTEPEDVPDRQEPRGGVQLDTGEAAQLDRVPDQVE